MTDWHVHFGQYNDNSCYSFLDVVESLKSNGVEDCWMAYLTPKFESLDPAKQSFFDIQNKIRECHQIPVGITVHFLCWIDPLLVRSRFVSVEQYYSSNDYKGIAIHPFHDWDDETLKQVFHFADRNSIPVFIHTGCSPNDNPMRFEFLFAAFPQVEVHLAHCKDATSIVYLFSKYQHLFGDVAFCPKDSYFSICDSGFKDRILFGTDFPITHWYQHFEEEHKSNSVEELAESYKQTLEEMNWFFKSR